MPSLSIRHGNVSKSAQRRRKCHGEGAVRTLNLGLHIVDGVGRLHLEGDSLTREGFHENLHSDLNNPMCRLSLQPSWQLCVVGECEKSAAKFTVVRNVEVGRQAPDMDHLFFRRLGGAGVARAKTNRTSQDRPRPSLALSNLRCCGEEAK
jgi:hypothetical protein